MSAQTGAIGALIRIVKEPEFTPPRPSAILTVTVHSPAVVVVAVNRGFCADALSNIPQLDVQ